jgi:hypothetical protein
LAVSAPDEPSAEADEKYGMPPEVPATVIASVPLVVTGLPPTEKIDDGTVRATLVTVPLPPEADSVPPLIDRPEPTVISSAAPLDAVVRPRSLAVAIVMPDDV